MNYLADTNILLRWANVNDPQHLEATTAIDALLTADNEVFVAPQNIYEFWNVSTRPRKNNGFGFTPEQAKADITKIESVFPMLDETPQVYVEWRSLAASAGVSGVQVHDAHLAAIMKVHAITHLLTFNARDFIRYGITTVEPKSLL